MTRLLLVELTRLRWRRAVMVLLAACVLLPTLVFATTAYSTRPVSPSELASARQQMQQMSGDRGVRRELRTCEADPEQYGITSPDDCSEVVGPQLEWFLHRPPLKVKDVARGAGLTVCVMLAGLLILVGTTFAGADWSSGSMSNQLLFEPRRVRVWAAKGAAVLLLGAAMAAVVLAAFWSAIWLLASSRDIDTPAAVWQMVRAESLRAVVLAACGAFGAYALTMLFRSTVATLGILFGVTLLGSLLLATLGVSERWFLHVNVGAWLEGSATYYVPVSDTCGREVGPSCNGLRMLTAGDAAAYLGVLLAASAVASIASFRRRDVP